MPGKALHIVAFSIPYPPNYGGVIDVFYKLKALHNAGVEITLHCFEYDRQPAAELEKHCAHVYYYPRHTGIMQQLSLKPYIVKSRRSDVLLKRLCADSHPILFEGLHSCYYLNSRELQGRTLVYRESNIEHHYYYHLFRSEKNPGKKAFFLLESLRLRLYQRQLKPATLMLVVSQTDTGYLQEKFPGNKVMYLPSFHGNETVRILPGKGSYALYHGNLSVAENVLAAEFLIKEVFSEGGIPFKIAGLNPPGWLIKLAASHSNIELTANPPQAEMERLVANAQVNVMVTFQATGLKLKLLNTLYNGRWMLANSSMLSGTGLASLCETAETAQQMKLKIAELMKKEFGAAAVAERQQVLDALYSDEANARKLVAAVFE